MEIRRGMAIGLVGVALVFGSAACGEIGEKVAEEAVERNSDCEDIDIDADEGAVSGSCAGDDFDANVSGNAEVPEGWPAELAPPAGTNILTSTATDTPVRTLTVIGGLDGDVATVYKGIKAQLTAAGYTIDSDSLSEGPTGPTGILGATGADYTAAVTVSEDPSALQGNVAISYVLTAAG